MRTPRRRDGGTHIRRQAVYDAYLASHAWRQRRKAWYAAWLTQRGTPPACLVCDREWSLRNGHLHHLTTCASATRTSSTSCRGAPGITVTSTMC